jgi:single-strand DNA-binding protein
MSSVNKAIIVGRAGRDAEVRYMNSGMAVANVSLATSTKRKNKDTGEVIEDTQWHRVTFYDRLAEIAGDYVKKGGLVYVEGSIKYGTYTDKDGVEKNTTDIIVNSMQLLGGREQQGGQDNAPRQQGSQQQGNNSRQGGNNNAPRQGNGGQNNAPRQQQQRNSSGFDDMDDDIPF